MSVDPRFPQALLDDEAQAGARVLTSLAGRPDALVVLGSGLAEALDEAWGDPVATVALGDIPGVVAPVADGHGGELRAYEACGGVALVATGRTHLYEGLGARPVTALARAAVVAGISRAVLTNANGCLKPWNLGDVMAITDHVNFSGASPFDGPLFLDVSAVWDSQMTQALRGVCQREGIYAILRGPEYQTMAETRILAGLGVDCVGMSTVMEAITLRALGVRVAGMSVVSDLSFADAPTDPTAVVEAASAARQTVVAGIEAALGA